MFGREPSSVSWSDPAVRCATISLLLFAAACAGSSPAEPVTLRVLCWNVHHGEGRDGRVDLDRIAAVVRRARPHLVSLQEVDRGVRRTGGVDQPAALAERTGLRALFARNIRYQGGDYGNAILTALPVRSWRNHALPALRPGEQRGVLEAVVETAAGPLRFLATHWDYRPDDRERLASIEAVESLCADGAPTVLAGDLNARSGSRVLARLLTRWRSALPSTGAPTFPAGEPDRQIDWVLFRPADRFRVLGARVLPEAVASDHRAILIELVLYRRPIRSSTNRTRSSTDISGTGTGS